MKTITVNIKNSNAIYYWSCKEEGSFEDHGKSKDHVFSILQRFDGKVTLTEKEAKAVLESGAYHSIAWNDDEIRGGAKTKATIARHCEKIRKALNS